MMDSIEKWESELIELRAEVRQLRNRASDLEAKQLRQRVAELEESHRRATFLRHEQHTKQLAASQLESKRLREALEPLVRHNTSMPKIYVRSVDVTAARKALSQPTDTAALEQYVVERLGEPVAWGNFKDNGEACMLSISQHPEDRANWMNPKPLYALKEPK